jgi:hypothetical protein
MQPTLSPRVFPDHTYLTWSTHSNLSRSHQQIWTDPLPSRRRAPNPTHGTTTGRFVGPCLASLPQQAMRQWGKDKLLLTTCYYAYQAHISAMWSIRWILARGGSTHRFLIDTGGATTLEVPAFYITLPDLPNRRSSAFHLRDPPSLRLSNINISH